MVEYCNHAVVSDGKLEKFIECDITGDFCPYQRVCIEKDTVVHTDDYKECKHLKQDVEQPKEKKASKEKNEYKVVLVASNYVVYEKDGKNLFLNGHYDVKIGEYIRV